MTYHYWLEPSGPYISEITPPGCRYGTAITTGLATSATRTKAWFAGQSEASTNVIAVYNEKWKQVGELTGLTGVPIGIATDSKADVWASNFPSNTLSEYAPGATTPTTTYTDANLSSLSYVTVDKSDNVYVSGQSEASGNLEVDELQSSAFSPIKTIGGAIGAGIAVAPTGKTLWVCDEGNGGKGTISAYTIPGFKRSEQFAYSGDDTGIAVAPSGKEVYAVDNVAYGSGFNVSVVIYNAKTGKVVSSSPAVTMPAKSLGIAIRR
jgi:DNA-binding beta-propeller fold protein YncE